MSGDTWATFPADTKAQRESGCPVGRLMSSGVVPAPLAGAVRNVIECTTGEHPAESVAAELRRRVGDKAPSLWALRLHRRGKCSCPKK